MPRTKRSMALAVTFLLLTLGVGTVGTRGVAAADLPTELVRLATPIGTDATEGYIWGAIAFSPTTGRHGFFWGGATRAEAERIARTHCMNAGGNSCIIVTEFVNVRRTFVLGPREPVRHCGALALSHDYETSRRSWGGASASTLADAEERALHKCGGSNSCTIREGVCT